MVVIFLASPIPNPHFYVASRKETGEERDARLDTDEVPQLAEALGTVPFPLLLLFLISNFLLFQIAFETNLTQLR